MMMPRVKCPRCFQEEELNKALTAQSNQNVIFHCRGCDYEVKNIETDKGRFRQG
ncbi:hypothetical protein [Bacillus fonticola]|uniref:hypothetical protein n=1 Tax=Bacillus fonticola TaxID=2728853 RepID=UPI00147382C4|nr:hypothetical protein [Bacillus fonticola]